MRPHESTTSGERVTRDPIRFSYSLKRMKKRKLHDLFFLSFDESTKPAPFLSFPLPQLHRTKGTTCQPWWQGCRDAAPGVGSRSGRRHFVAMAAAHRRGTCACSPCSSTTATRVPGAGNAARTVAQKCFAAAARQKMMQLPYVVKRLGRHGRTVVGDDAHFADAEDMCSSSGMCVR